MQITCGGIEMGNCDYKCSEGFVGDCCIGVVGFSTQQRVLQ